jgi:ABC-type Fe3+/spermidine/putrescine transport system ATPase subunit
MSIVENLKIEKRNFKLTVNHWEILDEGIHVLMGPSGSGKSTILKALMGFEETPGLIWKLGELNLAALPIEKRNLGVVFQTWDLFPHMTAFENVRFAAKSRKLTEAEFDQRWSQICHQLKMENFIHTNSSQLSGGEKQRTALARAIIGKPRFLLLDEPFSALDVELRQEARIMLKELVRSQKIPTLIVTHDLEDVRYLSDQVSQISEIASIERSP